MPNPPLQSAVSIIEVCAWPRSLSSASSALGDSALSGACERHRESSRAGAFRRKADAGYWSVAGASVSADAHAGRVSCHLRGGACLAPSTFLWRRMFRRSSQRSSAPVGDSSLLKIMASRRPAQPRANRALVERRRSRRQAAPRRSRRARCAPGKRRQS